MTISIVNAALLAGGRLLPSATSALSTTLRGVSTAMTCCKRQRKEVPVPGRRSVIGPALHDRSVGLAHMKGTIQLITLLILALATQPGFAGDHGRGKGGKQRHKAPQGGVTAAQAAAKARRQTGGRVLAVQQQGGGYRVKVLTGSGEVRAVKIPGRR